MKLKNNAKIGVVGGGPAGSMFAYFLKKRADRLGLNIEIDLYEKKDFNKLGPAGCNKCGGIVSESLVQLLAAEGIVIDKKAIQKGIENYVMHTDVGSVTIKNTFQEKRIVSVYRGGGPLKAQNVDWVSFDGYLLNSAKELGVNIIHEKVKTIKYDTFGKVILGAKEEKVYDFVAVAAGMEINFLKQLEKMGIGYKAPKEAKTFIREIKLTEELVNNRLGDSMHVFLLDIPKLKFAAIIPKREFATVVLLGDLDQKVLDDFLNSPPVKKLLGDIDVFGCACKPSINVKGAVKPYANRLIVIGDSGISKLYKNGIGAAYYTARAAANCVVTRGIDEASLRRYFYPECEKLEFDNNLGKIIFAVTTIIQKIDFLKRGMVKVVQKEQLNNENFASGIFWDIFTGSADYKDILFRALSLKFLIPAIKESIVSIFKKEVNDFEITNSENDFGKVYKDGEIIVKEGDVADKMFLILEGEVEVFKNEDGEEIYLATLKEGDVFGEQVLIEEGKRSASVRAKGEVKVISIDKKILLNRVYTDPSIVMKVIENLVKKLVEANKKINQELLSEDEFNEVIEKFRVCGGLPMSLFKIVPEKRESYVVLEKILEEKTPTQFVTVDKEGIKFFAPFDEEFNIDVNVKVEKEKI